MRIFLIILAIPFIIIAAYAFLLAVIGYFLKGR